jgi:hypothetical protein
VVLAVYELSTLVLYPPLIMQTGTSPSALALVAFFALVMTCYVPWLFWGALPRDP